MGTRNLTAVYLDGQFRVAQYGQWDGYLEGQGRTIVEFLQGLVNNGQVERFKEQVRKCRFMTDAEIEKAYAAFSDDGWMTMEQADRFKASEFGHLSRDVGAKILEVIHLNEKDELGLSNHLDFVADSLFCEWAYVVDLDAGYLEVYEGFNKIRLEPHDRFYAWEEKSEGEYHPVKLLTKLLIDDNITAALDELVGSQNQAEAAE